MCFNLQHNWNVAGSIPEQIFIFFNLHPSSCTVTQWSTQPQQKWVPRIFVGKKGSPGLRADLTATCKPNAYELWEPWRLASLWTFTLSYNLEECLPHAKPYLSLRPNTLVLTASVYVLVVLCRLSISTRVYASQISHWSCIYKEWVK